MSPCLEMATLLIGADLWSKRCQHCLHLYSPSEYRTGFDQNTLQQVTTRLINIPQTKLVLLSVFDPSLAFKKSFPGNLDGLAKGEGGEVYTIQHTPYSFCIRILYPEAGDLVWEKETNDMGNRPTGNIITAATHHLPAIESLHLFEKGGSLYISDAVEYLN